jgi:hypothetical protein
LLQRQPGVGSSSDDLQWYADSANRFTVFLGLNLAALGVVAFLWFMAVIRRRLGEREDQLLATVFLGSGIGFALLTIRRPSARLRRPSLSTSATLAASMNRRWRSRMDCGSASGA